MAQPTEPPLSIRIPAELRARVKAWAKQTKRTRNAAIAELLERGLHSVIADMAKTKAVAATKAARDAMADEFAKPTAEFSGLASLLQLGPEPSRPGSRLKAQKK